jgi:hypothetical protein
MKTKTCPFCKEKIIHDAIVCRYCTRDLPPEEEPSSEKSPLGWFSTLIVTAVIVSSTALLVVDFLKERRRWLEK